MTTMQRLGTWLKRFSDREMVGIAPSSGGWQPPRFEPLMRVLEPRMMYDAAGFLTGLEAQPDTHLDDAAGSARESVSTPADFYADIIFSDSSPTPPPAQEILFVDP